MGENVLQDYQAAVAHGQLQRDEAQQALAARLAALASVLNARPAGILRAFSKRANPRGLYIWGPVGRGKTMLMDMFFGNVRSPKKRRVHFHAFMRDVHERVFEERQENEGDALLKVADDIARESHVLCFDEMNVADIADAMILGRLFTQLFRRGVTVVTTSNVPPEELYRDGLNRPLFEPFIALVRKRMDVVHCTAEKDFRLERLEKSGVYFKGSGAHDKFEAAWRAFTQGQAEGGEALHIKGRRFAVPRAVVGACRFTFGELCEAPHSAEDYLVLAAEFHTLFLQGIPRFGPENRNALRRFINLIDVLYDSGTRLIAQAEGEPGELLQEMDGHEAQAWQRTASRLVEMRSNAYLSRAHAPPGAELENRALSG